MQKCIHTEAPLLVSRKAGIKVQKRIYLVELSKGSRLAIRMPDNTRYKGR